MFDDLNFQIDMIKACRSNRFDEQKENDDDPEDLYCAEVLDFDLTRVVNKVIKWYTDDDRKRPQLDEKVEIC